jgi:hypothetical protein
MDCTDGAGNTGTGSKSFQYDGTAPTVTVTPDRLADHNGWYNHAVVFSAAATNNGPSGAGSCDADETYSGPDSASASVLMDCTDGAGNTGTGSKSFQFDKTAPTNVTTSLNRSPDHNGWYNQPVGWTTTGDDAPSGIDTCSNGTYSGPDGSGKKVSGHCTDKAGNASADADSATFDYDASAPQNVAVTGFADGAVFYTGGALPTPGCSTPTDTVSGVATSSGPTKIADTRNANGVGSVTYRCSATDNAGNSASDTKTFVVRYGGNPRILQPINADNTSVFSRGRAVPVKFQLAGDEPNGFSVAGWSLQRLSVNCTAFDSVDAELEPIVENPSNTFRYDAAADQYVNNVSFKDQPVGSCWKVRVTLNDSPTTSFESAVFKLQK